MMDEHIQPEQFHTFLTYPPRWYEDIAQSITGNI